MKKIFYTFCLAVLCSGLAWAQPSLTMANTAPTAGQVFYLHATAYHPQGNSGANQRWDFKSDTAINTSAVAFNNPAGTPFDSTFLSANLVTPPASGLNYIYYHSLASGFYLVGQHNGNDTIRYSDSEMIMKFPFNYNDTYTDNFRGTFYLSGSYWARTGSITVTADAWGKLVLNFDSFTNVMRLHIQENFSDSSTAGTGLIPITRDSYEWFLPNHHYPICTMRNITVNGGAAIPSGEFMDKGSVAGMLEHDFFSSSPAVFPNPASGTVNLTYSLAMEAGVQLEITNLAGQVLSLSGSKQQAVGAHQEVLHLEQYGKGNYLITVIVNGLPYTKQVTIQ